MVSNAITVDSKRDSDRCGGLTRNHSARMIIRSRALKQNNPRGHYELAVDARHHRRVETAFTELARTI